MQGYVIYNFLLPHDASHNWLEQKLICSWEKQSNTLCWKNKPAPIGGQNSNFQALLPFLSTPDQTDLVSTGVAGMPFRTTEACD